MYSIIVRFCGRFFTYLDSERYGPETLRLFSTTHEDIVLKFITLTPFSIPAFSIASSRAEKMIEFGYEYVSDSP